MAGYRRVNYYELCRLCTSSEGTKMHIFREEGRRRSLPSKIQKCLPLQVQEEDSLPKIICSTCVEKLESYYEFREACVNAEAMLESYFTSLKYSEDFMREGKVSVYVKDEPKKKDEGTSTKVKIPVNNITNISSTTNLNETNSIQPSAIQILTDTDGNRLTQYKVQVQGGIPSLIPLGSPGALPLSVSISALTPQPVKQQSSSTTTRTNNRSNEGGTQTSESSGAPAPPPLVAAVAITPQNQDLLQQLALVSKDRNMVTELLKLKNVNVVDAASYESMTVNNTPIQGNTVNSQIPNLIPASIRLDQLNQLINSNLQINLSQIQQQNQEENTLENKSVIISRNVSHVTTPNVKPTETNGKANEDVNTRDQKVTTTNVNGNNDRVNNTMNAKTNLNMNEIDKTEDLNLEGEIEEVTAPENQQQMSEGEEKVTYECEFCSKLFKRKEHLLQHRKSHSGERPFVCTTCDKAFSRKEHLLRHNVCHTGQKQYMCDVCRKSFSRKDNLLKHKKTHGITGPHVCETCGKSFVVRHYYLVHKAQHKNLQNAENSTGTTVKYLTSTNSTTNPLPFKCDLCTKSFCMKEYLTSHRMRHRSKIKKEEPLEDSPEPPQTSSDITVPQPTVLSNFPAASTGSNLNLSSLNTQLTTINPNALLAPNIIHHSSANVVHIGNNSYLCAPNVAQELLDQYRKLHTS